MLRLSVQPLSCLAQARQASSVQEMSQKEAQGKPVKGTHPSVAKVSDSLRLLLTCFRVSVTEIRSVS